ncbi:MAG: ATP-binding protein [Dysgonomonas mossii]|uniref:PAS domain-containing hybrid sensor histidine kinase/response regulator n=1 Tax=Dysgonomonas TaxID=156973 RepID=UPI0025C6F663|nr:MULTISPECIES: ATP-binding protein [unclassified Dysgonomonas]
MDIKYRQYSKDELIQRIKDLEYDNFALQKELINKYVGNVSYSNTEETNVNLLHDRERAFEILLKTCDSLFLFRYDGTCVDCIIKSNHWFLKSEQIVGQNIFDILPEETALNFKAHFDDVVTNGGTSSLNYDLPLKRNTIYFKCIIQLYEKEFVLCQYRDITQRSQMKKRLDNANRKLKETQKIAKIGHWKYNPQVGMLYYSGFGNIFSIVEEEAIISIDEYSSKIHPADKEAFIDYLNGRIYNGKYLDYRRVYTKDNYSIVSYIRTQITSVYEYKGETIIEGYVQNIDDVIKNRWEYETVNFMNNVTSDHVFGVYMEDGQLIFANQQFLLHNNISKDKDISDYKISDLKQLNTEQWELILKNLESNESYKYNIIYTDSETEKTSYFDCISYLTRDTFGTKFIWSYWSNTTKQKYAEIESKNTRNLMNMVLDNMPISVFIKNPLNDYRYIYWNKISTQFYLVQNDDFSDKTDFDIFPKELAERYRAEDIGVFETGVPQRVFQEFVDDDGNIRYVDILKIRLNSETDNSSLVIGLGWDITELKKIEKELTTAKLKAEQLDKLKSAFLSNMSHEIRTPLNAILGFSRIIAETDDQEKRNYYFNFVESNSGRLLALVNEILDFSKIESGIVEFEPEDFDFGMLCLEIYETYASQCHPETELIYNNIGTELWIRSDRNRIHQVLSNLIINAQKFTKKGYIKYGFEVIDNKIKVYVNDTGIGIIEDQLDKIFERFMQVDSNAIGTGLGLAICRSIVERLGGEISVKSELEKGSCFTFTLPYEPTKNVEGEINNTDNSVKNYSFDQNCTILVADDDDNSYQLIDAMIGEEYTLLQGLDGVEAVRMFEEYNPDMILMDLNMPTLNGFEATKIIRQVSPDIIIIAISAKAYEKDIKKAIDSGCNEFLAKPICKDKLIETIHKYII